MLLPCEYRTPRHDQRTAAFMVSSTAPPEWSLPDLARKPNYDFEKRRKELERKAKKDAKREDRLQRKREGNSEDAEQPAVPAPAED